MHAYIKPLRKAFELIADKDMAKGQQAYMKNLFPFFGIKTDDRRTITKAHFKEKGLLDEATLHEVVKELWELPNREYQYAGQELLHFHRKTFTIHTIKCIEHCITHKSWWDTVDALNTMAAGVYFEHFPQKISSVTGKWNRSDDMWLNRSSLLFQLKYKQKTDTALLASYIETLAPSKEFFIRKAIGWILREYAKTNPDWVREFVETHGELSGLSKREALKAIG
jgi:3-methyladenine DNA glycosylase AlkD